MKNIILYCFFLFLNMAYGQNNYLKGNYFVSMPDKDTYVNLHVLGFGEKEFNIQDYLTSEAKTHKYILKDDGELIVNDTISWGKIRYKEDYFELANEEGHILQYTKLKQTKITCTQNELEEMITSSYWDLNAKEEKGRIFVSNTSFSNTSKFKYRILKVKDTYMLLLDNTWNLTIRSISKNKISFYGIAKTNNISDNVEMTRVFE